MRCTVAQSSGHIIASSGTDHEHAERMWNKSVRKAISCYSGMVGFSGGKALGKLTRQIKDFLMVIVIHVQKICGSMRPPGWRWELVQ